MADFYPILKKHGKDQQSCEIHVEMYGAYMGQMPCHDSPYFSIQNQMPPIFKGLGLNHIEQKHQRSRNEQCAEPMEIPHVPGMFVCHMADH